jgi:Spy/CpxP family protein refolding chaperone
MMVSSESPHDKSPRSAIMATRKTTFLRKTLFCLSLITTSLLALPAAAEPGRQLAQMGEALDLSAAQFTAIESLIEAHRSRMGALGLDPETRREGRAERHALMQEIQSVLTPEQRQQWMEHREQRRRQHQRHGGENRLMQTLAAMELSDDQRTSIDALIADNRQRGRAARESFLQSLEEILSPEQWAEIQAVQAGRRGPTGRRSG